MSTQNSKFRNVFGETTFIKKKALLTIQKQNTQKSQE